LEPISKTLEQDQGAGGRQPGPPGMQIRVTERFRRVNYGTLEIELTIDDPKACTKPWTIKVTQIIAPDTELLDYICLENEKDVPHLQSPVR
jgi:hypothetical protein